MKYLIEKLIGWYLNKTHQGYITTRELNHVTVQIDYSLTNEMFIRVPPYSRDKEKLTSMTLFVSSLGVSNLGKGENEDFDFNVVYLDEQKVQDVLYENNKKIDQ